VSYQIVNSVTKTFNSFIELLEVPQHPYLVYKKGKHIFPVDYRRILLYNGMKRLLSKCDIWWRQKKRNCSNYVMSRARTVMFHDRVSGNEYINIWEFQVFKCEQKFLKIGR
jgi:hypothetical protein